MFFSSCLKNLRVFKNLDRQHALWLVKHYEFLLGGARSAKAHIPMLHDGAPLPWYTYAALHFLDQLDFSKSAVFEYGSGNSSLYWSSRAKSVSSVEIDEGWYQHVSREINLNQKMLLEPNPDQYARSILLTDQSYDVIVVDGAVRFACMQTALQRLAPSGLLVFDNSDWFPNAVRYLQDQHFQQIDFIGPGPINKYTWSTSVFFKDSIGIPRKQTDGHILVCGGLERQSSEDVMPKSG